MAHYPNIPIEESKPRSYSPVPCSTTTISTPIYQSPSILPYSSHILTIPPSIAPISTGPYSPHILIPSYPTPMAILPIPKTKTKKLPYSTILQKTQATIKPESIFSQLLTEMPDEILCEYIKHITDINDIVNLLIVNKKIQAIAYDCINIISSKNDEWVPLSFILNFNNLKEINVKIDLEDASISQLIKLTSYRYLDTITFTVRDGISASTVAFNNFKWFINLFLNARPITNNLIITLFYHLVPIIVIKGNIIYINIDYNFLNLDDLPFSNRIFINKNDIQNLINPKPFMSVSSNIDQEYLEVYESLSISNEDEENYIATNPKLPVFTKLPEIPKQRKSVVKQIPKLKVPLQPPKFY